MANVLVGRRVLVVEDEMLVLFMIEDILADLGCKAVSTAATVDQALALIEAQTFDVAMLDSNLNGMRSDPIADALEARGVPFFFATGYSSLATKDGYTDRYVLKKPFQRDGVEASFRHVLSVIHEQ
jgi:DNA-binding NtrC family response regulator